MFCHQSKASGKLLMCFLTAIVCILAQPGNNEQLVPFVLSANASFDST